MNTVGGVILALCAWRFFDRHGMRAAAYSVGAAVLAGTVSSLWSVRSRDLQKGMRFAGAMPTAALPLFLIVGGALWTPVIVGALLLAFGAPNGVLIPYAILFAVGLIVACVRGWRKGYS
jgi:urea transporter